MKKLIPIFLALVMLTACGTEGAASSGAASGTAESALSESVAVDAPARIAASAAPTSTPTAAPESEQTASSKTTAKAPINATPAPTDKPAPTTAPAPAPTAVPTAAPVVSQPTMTGGSLPLDVAANSDQWWAIDSSDSAYWAVADNINAIRAAGGLGALSVDGGLSSAASSRCENFVAGGAFDHSGMTTVTFHVE